MREEKRKPSHKESRLSRAGGIMSENFKPEGLCSRTIAGSVSGAAIVSWGIDQHYTEDWKLFMNNGVLQKEGFSSYINMLIWTLS